MAKAVFDEQTGQESSKPADMGSQSASDMRNQLSALYQGDFSPLRARAQSTPDMTVAVNPAVIQSFFAQVNRDNQPVTYAGGNSPSISAPSSNPRIDILYLSSGGSLAWVTGAESATPSADWASLPSGAIPIAAVYAKTSMTSIVNYEDKDIDTDQGYICEDVRPFLSLAGSSLSAGSGIDISSDIVSVGMDTDPGLEFNATKLRVKAGDGIARSAGGVTVNLDTDPGLEIVSGKLRAKNGSAIGRNSSGLYLDIGTNKGLQIVSGKVEVKAGSGITVDSNGVNAALTPDYDSGWFSVSGTTEYTKAHGLSSPVFKLITIYWRANSSATVWYPVSFQSDSNAWGAAQIRYDNSNIMLRRGGSGWGYSYNGSSQFVMGNGDLRIRAWV